MRHALLVTLVLTAGCGAGHGHVTADSDAAVSPILSITVAPSDATVTSSDAAPGMVDFTATAHYADGHDADVTNTAQWSLADPALGTVGAGHVVASSARGGSTVVQANLAGASSSATLTVALALQRILADDGSTAPADSAAQFAAGTETPAVAPSIAYPLDNTFLPSNLGSLEIQWKVGAKSADLYEITLQGKSLMLTAYTNAVRPGGSRFFLKDSDWSAVASTVNGGLVTLTVRARSSADHTLLGTSKPVTFTIGVDDVQGGIYYWAATGGPTTEGVQRHAFGDTKGLAKPFYTQSEGYLYAGGENHCVACHVLSRDGTKMATTFDGGDGVAGIIDVATKKPLVSAALGLHWNFASFNPDGTRIVTSSHGALTIRDPLTGGPLDSVTPPAGTLGTHPDWSPDGTQIVYTSTTNHNYSNDWTFTSGSIVVATDAGAGFGKVVSKVLVQSKGENNYYPSFSPDGRWILFNRSNNNAYANSDATVWLVSSDGSVGPMHLTSADIAGNTDSWCRWSPFVQHNGPDGDLLYFTYSSKRDYGIEIVAAARPQIWMAAFDPKTGEVGSTPSTFAPFWLPFQDSTTSNHIAQWTQALVGIQ